MNQQNTKWIAATGFASMALLFSAFSASTAIAGNNGDVKIHQSTTAVSDQRDEPKVCSFYLDGFNFDSAQIGIFEIAGQGGANSGTGSWSGVWGPADSAGAWHTANHTLSDGMYKLTWDTGQGGAQKAKVFRIDCTPAVTASSTPSPTPTQTPTIVAPSSSPVTVASATPTPTATPGAILAATSTPTPSASADTTTTTATTAATATTATTATAILGQQQQAPAQAAQPAAVQAQTQQAPVQAAILGLPSSSTEAPQQQPAAPILAGLIALFMGAGMLRLARTR